VVAGEGEVLAAGVCDPPMLGAVSDGDAGGSVPFGVPQPAEIAIMAASVTTSGAGRRGITNMLRPVARPGSRLVRSPAMEAFELADLAARRAATSVTYLEFLKVPDLSVGLYVLAAGQPDLQRPHAEDEVYYVVSGSGMISVGDEVRDVVAGSIVFVAATIPHRFHDIIDDLTILVVFGPAEGSRDS
jgi:mannose-6-phosphate isomerase-like protein (cupin superfamily)